MPKKAKAAPFAAPDHLPGPRAPVDPWSAGVTYLGNLRNRDSAMLSPVEALPPANAAARMNRVVDQVEPVLRGKLAAKPSVQIGDRASNNIEDRRGKDEALRDWISHFMRKLLPQP